MIIVNGYLCCFGEHFSPKKAAALTGVSFYNTNEPGDIGTIGRYRGKPLPYGSGQIDYHEPKEIYDDDLIATNSKLIDIIKKHTGIFRECGAEKIELHAYIFYNTQCNMTIHPKLMRILSDNDIIFTISVDLGIPDEFLENDNNDE